MARFIFILTTMMVLVASQTHARAEKPDVRATLEKLPDGTIICSDVRRLAANVEKSSSCLAKGTTYFSYVTVTSKYDPYHFIEVTVYDNGWLPLVHICRMISNEPYKSMCDKFDTTKDGLAEAIRTLDAAYKNKQTSR